MYRQDETKIKREAVTGTDTYPKEIEVEVRTRASLEPDRIKEIIEITEEALQKILEIVEADRNRKGA